MGQRSSSQSQQQEQAEQLVCRQGIDSKNRQEPVRKAAAAEHMNQPYHASSHDELVLMVSLDSITKIM
ncbi:hypothetical protein HU200_057221 [Digitaria exilis]|uniref:Uncharacterized protein n=1 Tax=Digitaria exilis TaxID=1010633 RepID=A0A835E1P9_9POAL|nr:hypothetical protein HU200_057221 [Digitaria exilis]CAB3466012.1 unnamed protein product [Digitaria exilis]